MTVEFVDALPGEPHPGRGRPSTRHLIAEALRNAPGQWALIHRARTENAAQSYVSALRHAREQTWAPAGAFEGEWRKIDGEYQVFARYVGGES